VPSTAVDLVWLERCGGMADERSNEVGRHVGVEALSAPDREDMGAAVGEEYMLPPPTVAPPMTGMGTARSGALPLPWRRNRSQRPSNKVQGGGTVFVAGRRWRLMDGTPAWTCDLS